MEGVVIKRNLKTSLDEKTILFVPAEVFSWRGISSVQGFPYRLKYVHMFPKRPIK